MSVVLPRFARPLDRQTHNRYLQAYRRWACDQARAGKPVVCWCLYVWIAGNWRNRMNLDSRPMVRPDWSTKAQWQGWCYHKRQGGRLSFQEYLAKREKRSIAGQGRRNDIFGVSIAARKRKEAEKRRRKAAELADLAEDVPLPEDPPAPPQFAKHAEVDGDDGLRMEVSSILAKFARLGLAPKPRGAAC